VHLRPRRRADHIEEQLRANRSQPEPAASRAHAVDLFRGLGYSKETTCWWVCVSQSARGGNIAIPFSLGCVEIN
jgi:hypothetical protein